MKQFIPQVEPLIGEKERRAVDAYMRSGGWLTEFKETKEFERLLADYLHCAYVSVVSNGTVSLYLALTALGIGSGDEVIIPDLTMIASANAVLLAGATPVLVDIDPKNLCLDFSRIERSLSRKTKAVVLVLFNGRSPDLGQAQKFCKKHKLSLVEDAAQALGSRWHGQLLGTFGDIGSFSFSYPKIITTGQGGAVVTNNPLLIEQVRKLKDFGRRTSGVDDHVALGYNFKFSDLLAVVGITQLKDIERRVKRKKEIYTLYQRQLGMKQISFVATDLRQTCPWFVDVYVPNRDALSQYLTSHGIGTRPMYPLVHTQAPYNKWQDYKNSSFSFSEKISQEGLFLPSSLTLSDTTIKKICAKIRSFYL